MGGGWNGEKGVVGWLDVNPLLSLIGGREGVICRVGETC
jgi:hypothetical protein